MTETPTTQVLDRLEGVRQHNGYHTALCPAHEDQRPSLSINEGQDGRTLLYCHRGCAAEEIVTALGLGMVDLFRGPRRNNKDRKRIGATYDYRDVEGRLLFQAVRYEPKDFSQRRPDGRGGWTWNLKGVEPILYRLPDVLEAVGSGSMVFVCEGEKDVDQLRAVGLVATTNPMGAEKWRDSYSQALRGTNVVILPDNDDAGCRHAAKAAASLRGAASSVKVLALPGLPDGGDVSDWLVAGGTAEELGRLAREAPEWEPESAPFLSSAPRKEVADERNPPRFRTAREVAGATPARTEWAAYPWAAKGAITEVDGKIKSAGKTTFVSHIVRAKLDGAPFMGQPTAIGPAVWLTEQAATSFRKVLERAGLLDREDLYVLPWHDVAGMAWADVARAATDKALEVGADMLVVDTLAQFSGIKGDGENSAGDALDAMKPLQEAAARGLAVVFTRHERKGGGEVGESGRGSSAFGGAVDIILALRRAEGNVRPSVRVLESLSRFEETPDKLVVELADWGEYRALGDSAALAETEATSAILDVLPATVEKAAATAEVLDKLAERGVKRTSAMEALTRLADAGTVKRIGEGRRGNPYRYFRPVSEENEDERGSSESLGGGERRTLPMGATMCSVLSSVTPTLGTDERNSTGEHARRGLEGLGRCAM